MSVPWRQTEYSRQSGRNLLRYQLKSIFRSLGLEIGGAISLPLFLSQALSVTLYPFGLAEGLPSCFFIHNGSLFIGGLVTPDEK